MNMHNFSQREDTLKRPEVKKKSHDIQSRNHNSDNIVSIYFSFPANQVALYSPIHPKAMAELWTSNKIWKWQQQESSFESQPLLRKSTSKYQTASLAENTTWWSRRVSHIERKDRIWQEGSPPHFLFTEGGSPSGMKGNTEDAQDADKEGWRHLRCHLRPSDPTLPWLWAPGRAQQEDRKPRYIKGKGCYGLCCVPPNSYVQAPTPWYLKR